MKTKNRRKQRHTSQEIRSQRHWRRKAKSQATRHRFGVPHRGEAANAEVGGRGRDLDDLVRVTVVLMLLPVPLPTRDLEMDPPLSPPTLHPPLPERRQAAWRSRRRRQRHPRSPLPPPLPRTPHPGSV